MIPKKEEDSEITQRKSKSFIGLRLMSKILPAYYNKKYNNNYVFDAIPTLPREESGLGLSLKNNNNSSGCVNALTNGLKKHKTNEKERKDEKNFDQDAPDKTKKEERKDKANENNKSSNGKNNIPPDEKSFGRKFKNHSINQTNVIIYDGTYTHIGNVFNTVNNNTVVYNTNNMQFGENYKNQQGSKKKINQQTKALMKSKNEVENRHLQFLSCHFGDEWRDIGKYLHLTKEEISNKKFSMKEPQERSYQMMLSWKKKPENRSTTLGSLCMILWDSQKEAAQEAVKQLAANLNDLE